MAELRTKRAVETNISNNSVKNDETAGVNDSQ